MKSKEDNIIAAKSYAFAVRCVKLYKYLCNDKNDYIIEDNFCGVERVLVPISKRRQGECRKLTLRQR